MPQHGIEVREAHARDVRLGRFGLRLSSGVLRKLGIVFSQFLCGVDAADRYRHAARVVWLRKYVHQGV